MANQPLPRATEGTAGTAAPSAAGTGATRTRPDSAASDPATTIHSVADAILHTVIYADLFDYPLTAQEIHRYLTGYAAPLATIEEHLAHDDGLGQRLGSIAPFWFLAGRDHLVSLRQQRASFSQALWREARRYGRLVAALPFVRMVSITGSLTMNNVISARDDVDLLIVAARDRVWLARGLAILWVHLARRRGIELCPNYVLAEHRLHLGDPSLFIAHELAQLVPLYGLDTYQRLLESNAWVRDYLPNALPHEGSAGEIGGMARGGQRLLEAVLGGRIGDAVEGWERERKIPRLQRMAEVKGGTGATYTPDLCKGHVDDHAAAVHRRYLELLAAQGVGTSR